MKVRAHLLRLVLLEGTGVRFFLGDPNLLEYVENGLALDFQFS